MEDDYEEALKGLQSEQFKDNEPYLRDETTGEDTLNADPDKDDVEDDEGLVVEELPDEDDEETEDEEPEDEEPADKKRKPLSQSQQLTRALRESRAQLAEIKRERAEEKAARERDSARPRNSDGTPMTADQFSRHSLATHKDAPKKPDPYAKDAEGNLVYPAGEFDNAYVEDYDDYRDLRRDFMAAAREEFEGQSASDSAAPGGEPSLDELRSKVTSFTASADNKKVAGFDAAVAAAEKDEWKLSAILAACIVESEVGAHITVHLHKNPKLAEEIAGLAPHRQAVRFGKLEDQIVAERATAKKARASSAPAPIGAARGGGAKHAPAYDSENFEDVEKSWNKKK